MRLQTWNFKHPLPYTDHTSHTPCKKFVFHFPLSVQVTKSLQIPIFRVPPVISLPEGSRPPKNPLNSNKTHSRTTHSKYFDFQWIIPTKLRCWKISVPDSTNQFKNSIIQAFKKFRSKELFQFHTSRLSPTPWKTICPYVTVSLLSASIQKNFLQN